MVKAPIHQPVATRRGERASGVRYMSTLRTPLTGTEPLVGSAAEGQDATVLNFWQWAFGDLCPNDIRGVFSEWLVAQLLGIPLPEGRESWAAWDLRTLEGVTIEVKSCA